MLILFRPNNEHFSFLELRNCFWSCTSPAWSVRHRPEVITFLLLLFLDLKLENYSVFTFLLFLDLKLENCYFFTFTFSRPEVRKLLLFYVENYSVFTFLLFLNLKLET